MWRFIHFVCFFRSLSLSLVTRNATAYPKKEARARGRMSIEKSIKWNYRFFSSSWWYLCLYWLSAALFHMKSIFVAITIARCKQIVPSSSDFFFPLNFIVLSWFFRFSLHFLLHQIIWCSDNNWLLLFAMMIHFYMCGWLRWTTEKKVAIHHHYQLRMLCCVRVPFYGQSVQVG